MSNRLSSTTLTTGLLRGATLGLRGRLLDPLVERARLWSAVIEGKRAS